MERPMKNRNQTWLILIDHKNIFCGFEIPWYEKYRNNTSESILFPLCLKFIVSSVDVKEKNWSSDLQWNAVTNRHSRSVTHPCETKVIKQHLLQINLKASRSVTQSNTVYWNGILFQQQFSYSLMRNGILLPKLFWPTHTALFHQICFTGR